MAERNKKKKNTRASAAQTELLARMWGKRHRRVEKCGTHNIYEGGRKKKRMNTTVNATRERALRG